MKEKIVPLISIAVGFLAFVFTLQYWKSKHDDLARKEAELKRATEEIFVVVAARDIPQGTKITHNDLGRSALPRLQLPPDVLQTADDALKIIGKKAMFQIDKFRPITWSNIEGGTTDAYGLASTITYRMRAISIPVSGAAAVSSLVQPGDRVDMLGTFSFPSKKNPGEMESVTLTMLQDVTVLATGQQLANQPVSRMYPGRTAGTYSAVTVEVTPKEAELLVFAQQAKGQIALSLRNRSDVSFETDLPTVNFDHLQNKLQEYNNYRQLEIRRKSGVGR